MCPVQGILSPNDLYKVAGGDKVVTPAHSCSLLLTSLFTRDYTLLLTPMLFAVKYKVKVAGSDKVVMESPAPGLEFTLGEPGPNVIKAFVAAVKTMKRGEIVQLKIAPAYAYGEKVRAAMQRW